MKNKDMAHETFTVPVTGEIREVTDETRSVMVYGDEVTAEKDSQMTSIIQALCGVPNLRIFDPRGRYRVEMEQLDKPLGFSDQAFRRQMLWEYHASEVSDVFVFVIGEARNSMALGLMHLYGNLSRAITVYCHPKNPDSGIIEGLCTKYEIPLFDDFDKMEIHVRVKMEAQGNAAKYLHPAILQQHRQPR